jgi:hypothetical protein
VAVDARAGPVYRPRMRWILVVTIAMAACGGSDGAVSAPRKPSATPPPKPDCRLVTETDLVRMATATVPAGVSEDDAYKAALQFLVMTGNDIASKDATARTIITARFVGQTLQSHCDINEYRAYALRIAIVGRSVVVTMDCWMSIGWEASAAVTQNRGTLEMCRHPAYASRLDAGMPQLIIDGMETVLGLRDASRR